MFFFATFLALSFVLLIPVIAFNFTPGTPSECDDLPISWTGGTPPFQLLLSPVFGAQKNISIPPSAFKNGVGSFSTQIQMPQNTRLLLTMSDATGFNSGGTTPVLTIGASKGGAPCNTNMTAAFFFQLNSALTQCRPFEFTGYTGAVQPVTIAAFVPGGTAFELNPPVGPTSFTWNANVIRGTSMIFSMTDSQGRPGGSSDITFVGVSDDSSCLNSLSPSSTLGAPSPTVSSSSSSSPTSGSSASSTPVSSHGISIAAIAGTVVGGLLFLAVLITLGLFFLRRKRDSQTPGNVRRFRRTMESEIDLTYDPRQTPVVTPYNVTQNYDPAPRPYYPNDNPSFVANPFHDSAPQPVTHHQIPSQYQHSGAFQSSSQYYPPYPPETTVSDSLRSLGPSSKTEFEPFPQTITGQATSQDSMSTSQRKAAMAGVTAHKPSRFVVHTDAEDGLPQPNNDGVVELPPQYSERRGVLGVANPTLDSNAGGPPNKFSHD